MSKNKAIIVKKVKKVVGGGHHGGAWKVAYADFVTAMMAFFLLMWLLNMTSDEKRARLSAYFKYFSIYDSGGTSWMEKSSEIFGESGENAQKVFTSKQNQNIDNTVNTADLSSIEETLKKDIADKLSDVKDQVLVDIVDEGIRIQMIDKEGSLMFEQGNPRLTPKAKEVLKLIGEDIKQYPNKVIIEGHTDSVPYAGSQYSNWELSTERASSARKELEAFGLAPERITRVAGYADTDPLIKDNTRDPRNRRISITLTVPKINAPRKSMEKPALINSDEKQLNRLSEELRNMIDKTDMPAAEEKNLSGQSDAVIKGSSNGKSKTIIRNQEWPVIKNRDNDAMISEGKTSLKNGSSNSKNKAKSGSGETGKEGNPVIKNENKNPVVIKELSEPIIKF
ncbi:MAG: hypothetical protein C4581_01890 [Nitrospiraceae bacterium]|nr:MAG: hypothetical protein C4581_01890 [Nitrospiraceae bacterium]